MFHAEARLQTQTMLLQIVVLVEQLQLLQRLTGDPSSEPHLCFMSAAKGLQPPHR